MDSVGKKERWKQNLSAMKSNLEKTYEFDTFAKEESNLINALKRTKKEYVVFSDYRRNEGRRRFEDVKELIDNALQQIEYCDSNEAMLVYFRTLRSVSKQTRWVKVLESLSKYTKSTD
ncbi:MAG: hypothetical protein ACFFCP_09330 [Promethearchaeota archaeon]